MKKLVAFIVAMIMMLSAFTACGNVGGISDYPAELEEAGISQKDFEAMSDEQKQALLDELGIKLNSVQIKKIQNQLKNQKLQLLRMWKMAAVMW